MSDLHQPLAKIAQSHIHAALRCATVSLDAVEQILKARAQATSEGCRLQAPAESDDKTEAWARWPGLYAWAKWPNLYQSQVQRVLNVSRKYFEISGNAHSELLQDLHGQLTALHSQLVHALEALPGGRAAWQEKAVSSAEEPALLTRSTRKS